MKRLWTQHASTKLAAKNTVDDAVDDDSRPLTKKDTETQ